jgi:hypothetical protein
VFSQRREPEYANHYIACVGIDAVLLDGRVQVEAAPLANRYIKSLERANEELRRTNARLTREHLGKADAAAASELARRADRRELEEAFADLSEEHEAWIERCLGAEARERVLLTKLAAEIERTGDFDALPVVAARKAWRGVKRRRGSTTA